ncbi:MAG TPA: type I restriction-modification system subunit M N-terminal domain-containing protein [Candidatus Micrarchaeia archaeon]|nr:type I restriction-modification system subunit M N-terminal domain-containing protein [Candidatus Micrarchaeia archaeon]
MGIEDVLWKAADKLRGSMDASEYKHVVLGLVFLKYVDDACWERREALALELRADDLAPADAQRLLETRDEYAAEGVFWVPAAACWADLQAAAKQTDSRMGDQAVPVGAHVDPRPASTVLHFHGEGPPLDGSGSNSQILPIGWAFLNLSPPVPPGW